MDGGPSDGKECVDADFSRVEAIGPLASTDVLERGRPPSVVIVRFPKSRCR